MPPPPSPSSGGLKSGHVVTVRLDCHNWLPECHMVDDVVRDDDEYKNGAEDTTSNSIREQHHHHRHPSEGDLLVPSRPRRSRSRNNNNNHHSRSRSLNDRLVLDHRGLPVGGGERITSIYHFHDPEATRDEERQQHSNSNELNDTAEWRNVVLEVAKTSPTTNHWERWSSRTSHIKNQSGRTGKQHHHGSGGGNNKDGTATTDATEVPTEVSSPFSLTVDDPQQQPNNNNNNNNNIFQKVKKIGSKVLNKKLSFRRRGGGGGGLASKEFGGGGNDDAHEDNGGVLGGEQEHRHEIKQVEEEEDNVIPPNGIPRIISCSFDNGDDGFAVDPHHPRRRRSTSQKAEKSLSSPSTRKKKGSTTLHVHEPTISPHDLNIDVDKVKKLRLHIDEYKPQTFQVIVTSLKDCPVLEKIELIRKSQQEEPRNSSSLLDTTTTPKPEYNVRTLKEMQSLYTAIRFIPNLKTLNLKNFETQDCKLLAVALRHHETLKNFHVIMEAKATMDKVLLQSLTTLPCLREVVIQTDSPFPCAGLLESKSLEVLRIGYRDDAAEYEFQRDHMADLATAVQNTTMLTVLDLEPQLSSYSLRKLANALQSNSSLERFYFSFDNVTTMRGGQPRDVDTPMLALIEVIEFNSDLVVIQNHCHDRVHVSKRLKHLCLDAILENVSLTTFKVFHETPNFREAKRHVFERKQRFRRPVMDGKVCCQDRFMMIGDCSNWTSWLY